jgi:hypothetical protein
MVQVQRLLDLKAYHLNFAAHPQAEEASLQVGWCLGHAVVSSIHA